jgi:hypothetical protein
MKAVVVEIKDGQAALLLEDGCIVTRKNNDYAIGDVLEMKNDLKKKLVAIASAAATFLVMFGIGAWAYASPYSYVSVDVNPSIEYSVNRFNKVLDVKALNDDGEDILNELDLSKLKHDDIDEAVQMTLEKISEQGYLDSEDGIRAGLTIATANKNQEKAQEMAQRLENSSLQFIESNGDEVDVESIAVGFERVQEAKELGVTPGKLNLVEKLKSISEDPDGIDTEEWLEKPVKEIMKAFTDIKKSEGSKKAQEAQEKVQEKANNGAVNSQSRNNQPNKNENENDQSSELSEEIQEMEMNQEEVQNKNIEMNQNNQNAGGANSNGR